MRVCAAVAAERLTVAKPNVARDTFLKHATTLFASFSVCVLFFLPFLFASLHSSCTSYPSFRACMGCCLYIMYVKISFILVCLPKQTAFFLCFARSVLYFFPFQYLSFSFGGEVGVLVVGRFAVCYTARGKCVYNKRYIDYTHISYTI